MGNGLGLRRIQLKSKLTATPEKTGNCQIKSELVQLITRTEFKRYQSKSENNSSDSSEE